MDDLVSIFIKHIVSGDFASAHLSISAIGEIDIVKTEIQKLADIKESNVIDFALYLANEGKKDLIRSIFPVGLREFASGDKFKLVNDLGITYEHQYVVKTLGLQLHADDGGDRQAWAMTDDGLDRMQWVYEGNFYHRRIMNVEYGLPLKLAYYVDSDGDHLAYGGADGSDMEDARFHWAVSYWEKVGYYTLINVLYNVGLKRALFGLYSDPRDDIAVYGGPTGSDERFLWRIVPV